MRFARVASRVVMARHPRRRPWPPWCSRPRTRCSSTTSTPSSAAPDRDDDQRHRLRRHRGVLPLLVPRAPPTRPAAQPAAPAPVDRAHHRHAPAQQGPRAAAAVVRADAGEQAARADPRRDGALPRLLLRDARAGRQDRRAVRRGVPGLRRPRDGQHRRDADASGSRARSGRRSRTCRRRTRAVPPRPRQPSRSSIPSCARHASEVGSITTKWSPSTSTSSASAPAPTAAPT